MISPNRIRFCGVFSNELNMPDLIMDCAFESDNSEVSTFLTREAVASESYDGRNRRISSFKYTENFAPKFSFLKKGFGDFTQDEVRALLKYLTQRDTTGLLEAYDDDSNVISWASIGNFSEIQLYKIANKRVVGVTAVWDSISPFALSDLYTITKIISNATDNKITINIDTDDNKPVYPKITINHGYSNTSTAVPHSIVRVADNKTYNYGSTDMVENTVYYNGTTYYWKPSTAQYRMESTKPTAEYYANWTEKTVDMEPKADAMEDKTIYLYNSKYYWIDPPFTFRSSGSAPNIGGLTSVKITNQHYDFLNRDSQPIEMVVKNNTDTEKIVVDGANKVLSTNRTSRIFGDDFVDWTWLPLYDGKNEITVEGNCEVTLEWREVRKVGEY